VGATLAENADFSAAFGGSVASGPPDPPAGRGIPVVGENIASYWSSIAHDGAVRV
jgi:hypothetical protein